ncbi:MAG TPA: DUF4331 family protein [Candidatus Limnocylindria bacterium]|jgi:hypothetical protein|nr:DUF4331 family protein [Candidatus Limnocylindria bacterium]
MRTTTLRTIATPLLILGATLALVIGSAAFRVGAADHLDAPTVKTDGRIDINDVYVFQGQNTNNTVLAMTIDPAAGILSPTSFRAGALYEFKVSTNGDAVPDVAYRIKFGGLANGSQSLTVLRADGSADPANGAGGVPIGRGSSYQTVALSGGGMLWAGLRDDPFFFDLDAFKDFKAALLGGSLSGLASFCDGNTRNFFDGFNGVAIVLEVPDSALKPGTAHPTIKVWGTVSIVENGSLHQVERMGLPGINTIFNHSDPTKEAYNRARPQNDVANYTDDVAGVATLIQQLLGIPDPAAIAHGAAVAAALLPDVITYNTSSSADFTALNGRALSDDVIDVALNFTALGTPTGPLSDCIGNDSTFSASFPYLGSPNAN